MLPEQLRAHLAAESLAQLWAVIRGKLEGNGQRATGSVTTQLDGDGADRLSGLLGRPVTAGTARVSLQALDSALRGSVASRSLVSVVAELTGSILRDKRAERETSSQQWASVWAAVEEDLSAAGLAAAAWAVRWTEWLRASGVLTRLGAVDATGAVQVAVAVAADLLDGPPGPERALAELASWHTGSAHGLDDTTPVAALVLAAAAFATASTLPRSSADRRLLWQLVGIRTDSVSGTVMTWGLRPPGHDRWSAMMRDRADLGLVTHLTVLDLSSFVGPLVWPGEQVHGCENPQLLQAAATAGIDRPLVCFSGNPSAAGAQLLDRTPGIRYHGDFDWPGVAIARRLFGAGAQPWRFGAHDYLTAVDLAAGRARLALSGSAGSTPWDPQLTAHMQHVGVAVHEESLLDGLLSDLRVMPG